MTQLTTAEVAQIFGVQPATLTKWRNRREKKLHGIPPPRGNRHVGWRHTVAQVDAFVRDMQDAATSQQARAFYAARGLELDDAV